MRFVDVTGFYGERSMTKCKIFMNPLFSCDFSVGS